MSKNEKTRREKQQIHEDRWRLTGKAILGSWDPGTHPQFLFATDSQMHP